jgi:hypothetical protein
VVPNLGNQAVPNWEILQLRLLPFETGLAAYAGLHTAPEGRIDAVIAMAEPVETHFLWRPQLRDPGDEIVLEAAVNGRAGAIVTFNRKDYGDIPVRFGLKVIAPADALRRINS